MRNEQTLVSDWARCCERRLFRHILAVNDARDVRTVPEDNFPDALYRNQACGLG